ncbi:MAG: 5'-3' exonuclease H3TH domain-containing protein [bacterium]
MPEKERLIVIDANSVIHRAYHALPPLTTKKGELANAVYGFLLVFLRVIKEFRPDYIAAAFDLPLPTFRHDRFKEYKAKRLKTPDDLRSQITKTKEILLAFGVPVFEKEKFEADDIIGTLAELASSEIETIIVSGDFDVLQLVSPKTKAYVLRKGVKDIVLYDETLVRERYQGLNQRQIIDFKALRGDPSDNIPGVRGIGEKTAFDLIKEFNNLNNLYENISDVKPRAKELLLAQKENAFLSRDLSAIRKDAPIELDLSRCDFNKNYNKEAARQALESLEFYSLIKRLPS